MDPAARGHVSGTTGSTCGNTQGNGQGRDGAFGIPTVEDRLVQRAVARILEAVFEADFLDCQDGARHPLGNRPRALPRPMCIETRSAYTAATLGQRPLAFWRQ